MVNRYSPKVLFLSADEEAARRAEELTTRLSGGSVVAAAAIEGAAKLSGTDVVVSIGDAPRVPGTSGARHDRWDDGTDIEAGVRRLLVSIGIPPVDGPYR
ncbi:MAG TPA: hypothetical protein VM840_06125 [Actinomycetota bacterium]|nr:hypothetical protein [Actinomycetota bacterium]